MAFLRSILLFSILLISGCVSESNPRPSSSDLIAGNDRFGKSWSIIHIDVGFGIVTPYSCITDNNITYYPDGRYEVNEGLTKCHPDDPPGQLGTWKFISDEVLQITIGDSIQTWNIESLSSSSHEIGSTFSEGYRTYLLVSSN